MTGFMEISQEEMYAIDEEGSINWIEVCHVIVLGAGATIGGAIVGSGSGGIATAVGGIAGAIVAEIIWQKLVY